MKKAIIILFFMLNTLSAQKLLVYMDLQQSDHLKAYGVAYFALEKGINVEWLLNYRGGSFLMDHYPVLERELLLRGVSYESVGGSAAARI